MTKLTVDCYFNTEAQANVFTNMLAWMEMCGKIGHCTDFEVRVDGDGNARPRFVFETNGLQKQFTTLKKELCKKYQSDQPKPSGVDIKFSIE